MRFDIYTTETYDPSLCVDDWVGRYEQVDFLLYITKCLTPRVIGLLTDSEWDYAHKPGILHVTCTGWGGSDLEPNVPMSYKIEQQLAELVSLGYPRERIVMRIDPIIPVSSGLHAFEETVKMADRHGITRVRSSLMQMYRHVIERMSFDERCEQWLKTLNGIYHGKFFPDKQTLTDNGFYDEMLSITGQYPHISFECCASPLLIRAGFESTGCMSNKDLLINGLNPDELNVPKGHQRDACMCLLKKQLIPGGYKRGRCPNKCAYCYLKDVVQKKEPLPVSNELF